MNSIEKKRLQCRAWRVANRERYRAHLANRANTEARRLYDGVRDRPCMDCGGVFPLECMDFDHRDPLTKKWNISHLVRRCRDDLTELRAEIAKCDVVCANCHRVRTRAQKYVIASKIGATQTIGPTIEAPAPVSDLQLALRFAAGFAGGGKS